MLIALVLLTMLAVAYFLFRRNPNPQTKIHHEIQKHSDSIAVSSLSQPDSIKLRKLEALKIRIATARYNDSLQRKKDNR